MRTHRKMDVGVDVTARMRKKMFRWFQNAMKTSHKIRLKIDEAKVSCKTGDIS